LLPPRVFAPPRTSQWICPHYNRFIDCRRLLIRTGVDSARTGAHLLRHSLAVDLLRKGASLDEIGDVLGHRNQNTTAIYAKVDLAALRPLALAWPGGAQ